MGIDVEIEEGEACAENHRRLYQYVRSSLEQQEAIELFSCWSGDEELPCEHRREVDLCEMESPAFCFAERQLTLVHR